MKKTCKNYCNLFVLFFICNNTLIAASSQQVTAQHAIVVSEQRIASQVGADILRAGGNVIDAAVAVGYVLAVVDSCCGNIGGGGFMTIHFADGKNTVLNFREKAPQLANKKHFIDTQGKVVPGISTTGYLAIGVPGTVLGLDSALTKYGTMTRKQVMAPAIELAEKGYRVSGYEAQWFTRFAEDFRQQKNVAAIFLKEGKPYQQGDVLIQKNLANTLKIIAEQGAEAFYKGSIANEIIKASQENGGLLSAQDLAQYKIEELSPIKCKYRGYTIISAPPPTSGGVILCEMLSILENIPLQHLGYKTGQSVHDIVETMRYGFQDRNTKLADPDYIKNPIDELLSEGYTANISHKIFDSPFLAPAKTIQILHERTDTTHFSIADEKGNAVSLTYSLNGFYGSRRMAGATGFFLNNTIDDFTISTAVANKFELMQSAINSIEPGKRPLSAMTPTIVLKDKQLYLVLGSPGGPRIITSVLLTLLNIIDYGMDLQAAVDQPRFHYQGFPDVIDMEPHALLWLTAVQLKMMGYRLRPQSPWGAVEAIMVDPQTKALLGVNDYRRPNGGAVGC
jgi:gamma-glutamyltranspeptidase/glutathione hydrolase